MALIHDDNLAPLHNTVKLPQEPCVPCVMLFLLFTTGHSQQIQISNPVSGLGYLLFSSNPIQIPVVSLLLSKNQYKGNRDID